MALRMAPRMSGASAVIKQPFGWGDITNTTSVPPFTDRKSKAIVSNED